MKRSIAASLSIIALVLGAASVAFVGASVTALASTNTPPTIAVISNQTVSVDHPAFIPLFAGDAETATNNLQLSLVTSNATLVRAENVVFHNFIVDGNWYLTVVPTFGLTGTATNTVTVSDGTNSASTSFVLTVTPPPPQTTRFANSSPITIPDSGSATPYPSTINVTGMSGTITNVDLTVSKFAHTYPADVHMLLVGPTGQAVVIWSHCGGGASVTNVTVTLTDSATAPLPDEFEIWSELLRPADRAANNPPINNTNDFPAPAPGAPYTNAVAMSSFNGLTANGTWSLYVYDDYPPDRGVFETGWSLMITTTGGRELTVTGITAGNKVYDGTNSATINTNAATLVGVTGGDNVTLVATGASGAFTDKNVGTNKTVQIAGLAITGTNASNYSLASPAATTTANITPATLTVKADDQTRAYGASNPVFTASYSGFVTGEVLVTSGVTGSPSLTTAATPTNPVSGSPYPIIAAVGSLTATNYTFSFLNGSLTVTQAAASAAVVSSINPSCAGVAVNFTATVTPSGAGTPTGTIQFKIDNGNFGSPVSLSGNSATSGTISQLLAGGHTIAAVYSGDGNFNGTTSSNYTQTVNALPATPTAGNDGPVCLGATLHLTASTVSNATYGWTGPNGFVSTNQNPAISNVTANAAGTYNVTATVNGCASVAGTTGAIINSAPSISSQPSGATKCVGDTITFLVGARGNGLTYQWRKDGTNITAATSTNYTIAVIGTGDAGSYDCVVSGACSPPATSTPAILTVSPTAVAGTATATATNVCRGDATTITLSGSSGAIQWQSSTNNILFANISGETNTTVNTGSLVGTTYFRAVVGSGACTAATSTVASVSISSTAPGISAQPAAKTLCQSGAATFSVTASGNGPLGYAWRKRGSGWTSGWALNAGGGAFFTATSTSNNNSQAASNGGNDIDTAGRAWGLNNTGSNVTEALRPFPAALSVGQTFSIDMDNDSVTGTVGFGLQNSNTGSNRLQVYFVGGRTNYTVNDATGEHDSGVPVTWAGINVLVRLTSSNAYAATITRYIDGQTASVAGTLSNTGAVDRLRLFDANGQGGAPFDLYFNNVRVGNTDDNAADAAYNSGWINGSNGGQRPLVNGGDITNADTGTLTVSPAAPADGGVYDVSISDACGLVTISSAATLTVNLPPTTQNVTGGGAYCSGGSGVPVGLNGSQGGVSYQLLLGGNPTNAPVAGTGNALSFSNQTAAGSYTVVASNATTGCTASMTGSATVTINPTPVCTISPTNATICAGGSKQFTVTPSGGTPGYSFLWNNAATTSNITVSAAGTYTVTVTDSNGCTTSCSATLTVNPTPSCTVSPTNAAICFGGSQTFTVNPSGGTVPYNFLWSDGTTGSSLTTNATGTYSVTVTDSNGCTTSCSATLTVNPLPTVFAVSGGGAYCTGGVAIGLAGSQSGVSYQLLLGGNPSGAPVPGTSNAITFGNQTGVGTYTVTASNVTTGCSATMSGSATVTLTAPFACWQLQYFGCTNCAQADAAADPDGDGQNNLAEFLAGTVPTNNVSVLRITSITLQSVDALITWTTAGGHTNALQAVNGNPDYSTNYADVSGPIIITGSGDTSTNYLDVGGVTNAPARFYRVRLVP